MKIMKKVLITGSKGQLGLELADRLKNGYELILTNRSNFDIGNEDNVKSFIYDCKPDIIINCAAFTAVDLCEEKEDEAYRANALGPKSLAAAANAIGAKLVHTVTGIL